MRQAFLLFFLFIFAPNLCRSQSSTQEILKELDQTIRNKARYMQKSANPSTACKT